MANQNTRAALFGLSDANEALARAEAEKAATDREVPPAISAAANQATTAFNTAFAAPGGNDLRDANLRHC
jgi:hypothetical protein